MLDLVIYLIILLIFAWLCFENLRLRSKFNKAVATLFQVYVDKNISDNMIKQALEDKPSIDESSKESQEAFISFLNQSRDWAFKYIEDTQKVIGDFVVAVEPDIVYFDEYGIVGSSYPHYDSMKRISKAFKELKKVLPEPDQSDTLG